MKGWRKKRGRKERGERRIYEDEKEKRKIRWSKSGRRRNRRRGRVWGREEKEEKEEEEEKNLPLWIILK